MPFSQHLNSPSCSATSGYLIQCWIDIHDFNYVKSCELFFRLFKYSTTVSCCYWFPVYEEAGFWQWEFSLRDIVYYSTWPIYCKTYNCMPMEPLPLLKAIDVYCNDSSHFPLQYSILLFTSLSYFVVYFYPYCYFKYAVYTHYLLTLLNHILQNWI